MAKVIWRGIEWAAQDFVSAMNGLALILARENVRLYAAIGDAVYFIPPRIGGGHPALFELTVHAELKGA